MSVDAARRGPFPGLVPFGDPEWFCGREPDIRHVTAHVLARPLTVLFGPSGVGKTSLLQAGVIPRLYARRKRFVGGVLVCSNWVEGPSAAIYQALGTSPQDGELGTLIGVAADRLGGPLVFVLDQFEELFVRGDVVVEELADVLTTLHTRARLLISLREDALSVLEQLDDEVIGIFESLVRLDHLTPNAGREAITGPIAGWNDVHEPVRCEDALVDAVLAGVTVGDEEDGTATVRAPHLQIVMACLWEAMGPSRALTTDLLDSLGGTTGIVADHVDRELGRYEPAEQRAAAGMLRGLVTPSGAKIAHRVADLAAFANVRQPFARDVLTRLTTGSRIVESIGGDRFQLAHDALAEPVLDWCGRADLRQARHRARKRMFATVLFTVVLMVAAYLADGFDPLESASVGERFELRGAQAAPAEMIIVGIDDATLKKLRTSYPFSRKHHAEALDRIADGKPRAIAYDVVFTQRIDSSADYRRFGESIYGAGRPLVFAAQATSPGGKADIFDGSPETIRAIGGGAGFDGFEEDARQVVRRPTYSFDGVKSLAVATVEAAQRRPVARADFDRAYIDYRGPAGTIRTIPFWKLLPAAGRDRISSAAFLDKLVLIGATSSRLGDQLQAWGRLGADMSGVELQANALYTVDHDLPLKDVPRWLTIALIVMLMLVPPALTLVLGLDRVIAISVAVAVVYLATAWLLFGQGFVLAVVAPMTGLAFSTLGAILSHVSAYEGRLA